MKKRYELYYISSKKYNFDEFCFGFWYALRDIETGYNMPNVFIPFSNKRTLVRFLRKSGVICPHRVYRNN